jgi:hypothetical protein
MIESRRDGGSTFLGFMAGHGVGTKVGRGNMGAFRPNLIRVFPRRSLTIGHIRRIRGWYIPACLYGLLLTHIRYHMSTHPIPTFFYSKFLIENPCPSLVATAALFA